MALLGAAPDAACLSRWAANTSDARQRILSCGGLNLSVYALGSSLPESAHRSRYARKVAGAFSPRAITSEKNKKRLNRQTLYRLIGSGAMAQALVDIHDGLLLACFAVHDDLLSACFR